MSLIRLVQRLHTVVERLVLSSLTTLIYICAFLSIAHLFGWIERYIWWCLEREASKILNGAEVTLGSFRIDWSEFLQGKITLHASNVVLHTPHREAWQWESPLIGRVGKASVSCNAPITIFHLVFFRQELPVEVYSVQAWDIQVFVERHESVFNVYLCDPSLLLPPPPPPPPPSDLNDLPVPMSTADAASREVSTQAAPSSPAVHKQQAQKLLNDMINAVHSVGRATQKGKSWKSVVKKQRLELADKLRDLGSKQNYKEGVKVMRQVGKVAVESLNEAPKRLGPPEKRPGHVMKPVYARVGRIVLQDVRIFTKDSWIKLEPTVDGVNNSQTNHTSGWNKPIYIENLIVRSSELCPPMSRKDSDDLPAVYQTVDKILEVAWRRLVAEMAKSNTGRLFQTAVGEVLSIIKNKPTSSTAASTSLSSSKAPKLEASKSEKTSKSSTDETVVINFGGEVRV